jgi:hypothetical protein
MVNQTTTTHTTTQDYDSERTIRALEQAQLELDALQLQQLSFEHSDVSGVDMHMAFDETSTTDASRREEHRDDGSTRPIRDEELEQMTAALEESQALLRLVEYRPAQQQRTTTSTSNITSKSMRSTASAPSFNTTRPTPIPNPHFTAPAFGSSLQQNGGSRARSTARHQHHHGSGCYRGGCGGGSSGGSYAAMEAAAERMAGRPSIAYEVGGGRGGEGGGYGNGGAPLSPSSAVDGEVLAELQHDRSLLKKRVTILESQLATAHRERERVESELDETTGGYGSVVQCAFPDRQNFALEDAIGACSLEANMRVTNGIPLGSPLLF